jgi:hypothetical protein
MPVSQVNTRLFTRLPSDTGLGLLFATGTVSQIVYASGQRPIQFTLRHAGYALRCKVAPELEPDFTLEEGQWVRTTGHLSFSSQSARFHLLARDLELLSDTAPPRLGMDPKRAVTPAGRGAVPNWLSEIQRRAAAERLAPAEVPDWVQAMAPAELGDRDGEEGGSWGRQRVETLTGGADAPELAIQGDETWWSNLIAALDRSETEDVELTPEVLAQLGSPTGAALAEEPGDGNQPSAAPIVPDGDEVADSFLNRPYGQLFLLLMLAVVVAVILFLLYYLAQQGFL